MRRFLASVALTLAPALAFADGAIAVHDAYARSSGPGAITGAAFMVIENTGASDDRLIGVASDVATRVELHTHLMDGDGVMRMVEVEGGIAVAAGAAHALERGGDHVMLMGLTAPLAEGESFTLTLTFEEAGEVVVEVPVDLSR